MFAEAVRFWWKLGWISFGGTAAHIAIMHDVVVEKKRWISNSHFLHALSHCMLLPGPEAQQLAIYQLRYGDWRELFNQLQKIDAVTKADIRRVANKVFVDTNRTYAVVETEAPQQAAQPVQAGAQ